MLESMNNRLLIVFVFLFLAACQPTVYLMPTPIGLQPGKHDPFVNTPDQARDSQIVIGYVTNRIPAGEDPVDDYRRNFDDALRMGIARVEIGQGGQSWDDIYRLSVNGGSKQERRLHLNEISQLNVLKADASLETLPAGLQSTINILNRAIDESPGQELVIYVHGANSNFYRAASQAAQFRHFTGHQAIVLLYSWPSAENLLRYGTDVDNAQQSAPMLARYLRLLARHSTAKKINILAYSAGATLTTQALALLGNNEPQSDRAAYREALRLGSIYFAAPDTDFDEFIEEYRSYQDIVDNVTVTINHNDSILRMARNMHHGNKASTSSAGQKTQKSRLGKPDIGDLTEEQANWILAQSFKPEFTVLNIDWEIIPGLKKGSHDYWYQNPWTSTDVLLTFSFHAAPELRGLNYNIINDVARVWHFPADYEVQVDLALDRLKAQYQLNSQ